LDSQADPNRITTSLTISIITGKDLTLNKISVTDLHRCAQKKNREEEEDFSL